MAATNAEITQRDAIATEDYPLPINPVMGLGGRRLESIDILRGLLMLLMALDHSRDFFSCAKVNPNDAAAAWPALFLTRWVTNLCAPGFIALAGASVYLQKLRGKSPRQISRLLFTRGLWLVFLEVTLISFAWSFTFAPFLQVIWAVGISMTVLAALQRLPVAAVGAIGAVILLFHNLLDPIRASSFGRGADLWDILHVPAILTYHGHPIALAFYPLLPWVGVICVGYAFGPLAARVPAVRQRTATILGVAFLAVFAGLRVAGKYGDPFPWQHLGTPAHTAMSFFQLQKYPPSLEYCLSTFGFLLLLYAAFDVAVTRNWLAPLRGFVETYGRVPFFYYVPHIILIHGAALLLTMALHLDWHHWVGTDALRVGTLQGWGYSLPVVYCVWVAVVLILYLPCRWFSGVKARRRDWWLSYL